MNTAATRSRELSPEHRRRWLVRTMVAVVVVVAVIVGGPWFYVTVLAPETDDPLALSSPTPGPGSTAGPTDLAPPPIDVNGTWQVGPGSEAGYRLGEAFNGEQVTVTGRTEQVTGTVVIEGGALTQAQVVVDTGSIGTDDSSRDAVFRRALDTSTYPEATFLLSSPVDVAEVGAADAPVTVSAPGTLTFHGIAQAVTVSLQVQRTAEGVEVVGQIPIELEAYGLDAPDLPFVTVEPTGTVEVLLVLTR